MLSVDHDRLSLAASACVATSNRLRVTPIACWFYPPGTFRRSFGTHGTAAGQFDRPFDVAISADGHILVTDYENHRVQIFSEDGTFKKEASRMRR